MKNGLIIANMIIPPIFLWTVLLIFILVFILISLVLHHHWKYYGIRNNPKIFVKTLHWIISAFLIVVMTMALLTYESNF